MTEGILGKEPNIDQNPQSGNESNAVRPQILGRKRGILSAGSTRETSIPGTEIKRGIVTRFERGQILEAYQALRSEIREIEARVSARFELGETSEAFKMLATRDKGIQTLAEFRKRAGELEHDLDTLNRQFYENQTVVKLNDPVRSIASSITITLL